MTVQISNAEADDANSLAEVCALLGETNLPVEGVAAHFRHFLLARDDSRLTGCVGLEVYGEVALLRSLAVAPLQQKTGLGKQLTEQILKSAAASGAREVVLLTTTAADFFQRHFGFEETTRNRYDALLADSPEWHLPRCSSAVCLRLTLEGK